MTTNTTPTSQELAEACERLRNAPASPSGFSLERGSYVTEVHARKADIDILLAHIRQPRLTEVQREAVEGINVATHSHVDGRDLLAELHPHHMLDIKRRVNGKDEWFEADWLSSLMAARDNLRAAFPEIEQGGG